MPKAKRQKKESVIKTQSSVIYSQPNNNILYAMMGVITLFLVFMTIKVISLEKKLGSTSVGNVPQAQKESPLSLPNLKKYAKELGLNTGKFNKCLDSGEKKTLVEKDTAYGSSLGVQGTPGFFINGKFLGGAFPFSSFKEIIDKELDGTSSSICTDYSAQLQEVCTTTAKDPNRVSFDPVAKEIDVKGMTAEGPENAKVTIVEFSDFECPFCVRAYPTVKQILSEYKNYVRFYYKQFPLNNIHPNAQKAAEASLCAADQGKFWEWHDKIFELEDKGV